MGVDASIEMFLAITEVVCLVFLTRNDRGMLVGGSIRTVPSPRWSNEEMRNLKMCGVSTPHVQEVSDAVVRCTIIHDWMARAVAPYTPHYDYEQVPVVDPYLLQSNLSTSYGPLENRALKLAAASK